MIGSNIEKDKVKVEKLQQRKIFRVRPISVRVSFLVFFRAPSSVRSDQSKNNFRHFFVKLTKITGEMCPISVRISFRIVLVSFGSVIFGSDIFVIV